MVYLIRVFIFVLIIGPISVGIGTGVFPKKYFEMQKTVLKKLTPKSPDDSLKLLINGVLSFLSIICVLAVFISLIENIGGIKLWY